MKLTPLERLTLLNQFEIRKAVEKLTDHDQTIEVLQRGYELYYSDIFAGLDDGLASEDCTFVIDVLSMYRAIEHFKQEWPDDPACKATPMPFFQGFDGNNEGAFWQLARFLILKKKHFEEQLAYKEPTDGWNSHSEMVPNYQRKLARWRACASEYPLTSADVAAILTTR